MDKMNIFFKKMYNELKEITDENPENFSSQFREVMSDLKSKIDLLSAVEENNTETEQCQCDRCREESEENKLCPAIVKMKSGVWFYCDTPKSSEDYINVKIRPTEEERSKIIYESEALNPVLELEPMEGEFEMMINRSEIELIICL